MKQRIKLCMLLLLIAAVMNEAAAQKTRDNKKNAQYKQTYFGFGLGLDYGGFGIRAEYLPIKNIGIFGGVGYNLVAPAYNAGLSVKVMPDQKVTPVLFVMYGYNAVIKIKGGFGDTFSKTYYGITAGAGVDIKYGTNDNKISLAIMVPFRNSEFRTTYNGFENAGYKFNPKILPIAFSIGFNF